jgi:hypothetical protein
MCKLIRFWPSAAFTSKSRNRDTREGYLALANILLVRICQHDQVMRSLCLVLVFKQVDAVAMPPGPDNPYLNGFIAQETGACRLSAVHVSPRHGLLYAPSFVCSCHELLQIVSCIASA